MNLKWDSKWDRLNIVSSDDMVAVPLSHVFFKFFA